jgi:cilia- and flagella-associated protein 57
MVSVMKAWLHLHSCMFACTADLLACWQGSKVVFAGGPSGILRSFKYPLVSAPSELRCHAAAITCMRLFFDESVLFTAGDDGALFIFDVRIDVKAAGLRRDVERLPFAEEVMVTKSDLDERKARYHELETKYHEQLRQNQITIHIKDLETREKLKELTDKFSLDAEAEHQRYELLQQQKMEAELESNERFQAEEVCALWTIMHDIPGSQYSDMANATV